MSNDNEQENNNKLKVISKIEVNTKPKNYDNTVEKTTAKIGYVHRALDSLIKGLNKEFIPELDSKLSDIITSVGDRDKGLIKDLNDLKSEVEKLKSSKEDIDLGKEDEWQAPQFQGTDTEFMII